jgi:hypothetical protein
VLDEVRAKKFVLVDGAGRVRATLENWGKMVLPPPVDEDDRPPRSTYPCLTLRDADEQPRAKLSPSVLMMGKPGREQLLLMPSGGLMTHADGASLSWGVDKGSASVSLVRGNARATIAAQADGSASIHLLDGSARPRIQLSVDGNKPKSTAATAHLTVLDGNGKVLLRLPKQRETSK